MMSASRAVPAALPTEARALRLAAPRSRLALAPVALRPLGPQDVLIEVRACGICRTDLHVIDGELPQANYPVTPGHEIVGRVMAAGAAVTRFRAGDRVGVPWLAHTCGDCAYCRAGRQNLCDRPRFTGCNVDGGFAEFAVADSRFCLPIPARFPDAQAAPLLCAGLIGHRAYRATRGARSLGLYGFGAAAHLLTQIAVAQGRRVSVLTRPGDSAAQAFARELGAAWVGGSDEAPPEPLDAAIVFAPVGALVPAALAAVRKGGIVVCAGIHMSDVPAFPYRLLWGERTLCSVANLTRSDGEDFMRLAGSVPLRPQVRCFPLEAGNEAIDLLRGGGIQGAAVLTINHEEVT